MCGNSSRGGFYQLPNVTHLGVVSAPVYDPPTISARAELDRINASLEQHLVDARRVWKEKTGASISDRAFSDAMVAAKVTGLIAGGVGWVRVANVVPVEEFRGEEPGLSYIRARRGPGPALT